MRKPRSWNPRGYWENSQFIEINDQVLSRFGGSWHDPPEFPLNWETSPELEDLRQISRNLIQEDFAGAELWGWKEPRTCLTLPFWQQLLPPLSHVICLRSPLEVAQSLKRRNWFSLRKGVYLWLVYLTRALENTAAQERCFVFYENLMNDWRDELQHLSEFLGKEKNAEQVDVHSAIQEFIDPALRHHDFSSVVALESSTWKDVNESVKSAHFAYVALRREAKTNPDQVDQLLRNAIETIRSQIQREFS